MKNSSLVRILGKITQPFYGGSGHILMFHRVCNSNTIYQIPGQQSIEVSIEHFTGILDYFEKHGYTFLSLDDLAKDLLQGNIKKPFVVFTFDDGYIDNLEIAFPILKNRNIPFAIYVAPSFPDQKAVLWRYILQDAVRNKNSLNFSISGIHYEMDLSDSLELPRNIKLLRSFINNYRTHRFQQATGANIWKEFTADA